VKKIIIVLIFLFYALVNFSQLIFPTSSEMSIEKSNIAKPFSNKPLDIIKANDSMYYTFIAGGICPNLSVRAYKNGSIMPNGYEYGSRVNDLIIKQKNDLWLAIFKLQYIDDIGAREEIFLREKNGKIISTAKSFKEFDSKNVILYSDFTFINDSVILCVPSFKKKNGNQIPDFNSHLYYTNLDGKILDSISNSIKTIYKIERFENGFIAADNKYIYRLNNALEILQSTSLSNTKEIFIRKNNLYILNSEKTLIVLTAKNLTKKTQIENIVDLNHDNENIYFLKNNTISYIDTTNFQEKVTITLSEDKSINVSQFALKKDHILLGGSDTHDYKVSEFRAYNTQNKTTILPDVSITAKMDSFVVDTFQIHVTSGGTFIEYDNKAYYSYEVQNNGTNKITNGIVFSPEYNGINCSRAFVEKEFETILPGQKIKGSGIIYIRNALSVNICLYIPSIDNQPDQKPNDNKTCLLLSSTKQTSPITKSVQINPNPATDVIEIVTEANIKMPISIYDLNGKCALKASSQSIDISKLHTGIYIVRMETKEGFVLNKKLVKY
jgi:hypothetical protein